MMPGVVSPFLGASRVPKSMPLHTLPSHLLVNNRIPRKYKELECNIHNFRTNDAFVLSHKAVKNWISGMEYWNVLWP